MGIELSTAEIDRYMLQSPRLILCVSREGRAPLAVPMWFGWKEGEIYMDTLLASKKVGYIRKNPLVSCLVESGEKYFSLKAVLLIGPCEIIDHPDEVKKTGGVISQTKPIYKELFPADPPPHIKRIYEAPRAILRLKPDSLTSWDFAKVRR